MVKDGGDWHGLQTANLKNLDGSFRDATSFPGLFPWRWERGCSRCVNREVAFIFELQTKIRSHDWSPQLIIQTTSAVIKLKPQKIQAWSGFEPMTSAILLQCSTNWTTSNQLGACFLSWVYSCNDHVCLHINRVCYVKWTLMKHHTDFIKFRSHFFATYIAYRIELSFCSELCIGFK